MTCSPVHESLFNDNDMSYYVSPRLLYFMYETCSNKILNISSFYMSFILGNSHNYSTFFFLPGARGKMQLYMCLITYIPIYVSVVQTI